MANRSYLYAIDFDRTIGQRKKGDKVYGLSEYPYSIPLSYKILVSQDSKNTHSINWDYPEPIAIQGNFEKGKQKLIEFLHTLQSEYLFEEESLKKQIEETKVFLNDHKLKNIILECGEIYEMGDDELEDQNRELFEKDILRVESEIEEYLKEFRIMRSTIDKIESQIQKISRPKNFLAKLFSSDSSSKIQELKRQVNVIEQGMNRLLGIDYWSDILYFHFENE